MSWRQKEGAVPVVPADDLPGAQETDEATRLRARVAELEAALAAPEETHTLEVLGTPLAWDPSLGTMRMGHQPAVMMWIHTTAAAVHSGVLATVGSGRYALALRGAGRELSRWEQQLLQGHPDPAEALRLWARSQAVSGMGRCELEALDPAARTARFRVQNPWEGQIWKGMGKDWPSSFQAGKLDGVCSFLFGTPCRAEQTTFLSRGDAWDTFQVGPSEVTPEDEMDQLLESNELTGADMAVALQRLLQEAQERARVQEALKQMGRDLEARVEERTRELAGTNERLSREVQERRRAEELFRLVAETIPQAVIVAALPGWKVLYLNPACQGILGYSVEELGPGEEAMPRLQPDARAARLSLRRMRHFVSQIKGQMSGELRLRTARRQDRDVEYRLTRLGPERVLCVMEDVTERKKHEMDRERLAEQAGRARKMEALGLLAGGVAHDLNNILAGLVAYPDTVLEGLEPDDPLRAPITLIQQAGLRAAAVVEDLMTIARGVAVPRRRCSLNDVVADYLASRDFEELRQFRPELEVETRLSPALLPVRAARAHLARSLANLVFHTAQTIPGAGRVRILTESRYVEAPLPGYDDVAAGQYAVLSLEDDGPGTAPEDLARLFEPFFIKKVIGHCGTGLEMAVVWNTVQDHQGYIQVDSQPGRSRMDLFFPALALEDPGPA